MPINMEAHLIALGKRLEFPGFGRDGFGQGRLFQRQEDWFLKAVANNIALEGEGVRAVDADEMALFTKA